MSTITITDMKGESVGSTEIPDELLVLDRGDQAVRDVIIAYRAGLRAGTASTLTKGSVAGSNKKPWRQKGLGRARSGYRQSPVWRGGGVAFGPHPRSYAVKMPKKVVHLAFRRALTERLQSRSVCVLKELELSEPKTRQLADMLKKLNVKGMTLIVLDNMERNLMLAARNLPTIEMVAAKDLNVYQLVRYPNMIITQSGLAVLEARLKRCLKGGGR